MRNWYNAGILERHMSWLRVTLNGTDRGQESGIPSSSTGSARPFLVVNRILFIWAGWAYRTNKVEVLVPAYCLHYCPAQRYVRLLVLNARLSEWF